MKIGDLAIKLGDRLIKPASFGEWFGFVLNQIP